MHLIVGYTIKWNIDIAKQRSIINRLKKYEHIKVLDNIDRLLRLLEIIPGDSHVINAKGIGTFTNSS